jgi:hypothetical protein
MCIYRNKKWIQKLEAVDFLMFIILLLATIYIGKIAYENYNVPCVAVPSANS